MTYLGFLDVRPKLCDAFLKSLHLVVHLSDVIEEGKVLVFHLDEVGHNLVQVGIARNNLLKTVILPCKRFQFKRSSKHCCD